MGITRADREMLRELAKQLAEIAALPVHREKAELWRKVNDLESERPTVLIEEIPWHEMNVDDELTVRTTDEWSQRQEGWLRRMLYLWRHMRADMVVPDYLSCPLAIRSTGVGISEVVDVVRTDPKSSVISRHFHPQIVEPKDIEKIKMPVVTHDEEATEKNFGRMQELFGDIMPVKKEGYKGQFYSPWDNLVRWWGVEEALVDLVARPEMVNEAMTRLVDAGLSELEQMERLNVLTLNNDHMRVGPGGYSYTRELPGKDHDARHVRPRDMWGHATAQIFSAVSPAMHWEFALRHEMRWLERWGLNQYGCCDPLDMKMEIVRKIPRLRKVSMSPWIDVERAVREVGDKCVFSYKPSPAIVAEDEWRLEAARAALREVLEKGRGCHIEVILKDISTVRYKPERLWEWGEMAMEEVEEAGGRRL